MSDPGVRLYHRLPPSARNLAASLWGLWLLIWRRGPERRRAKDQALDREAWAAPRWEPWRNEQLATILDVAATRVPYYRRYWEAQGDSAGSPRWKQLENWPVLRKEELRADPASFVVEGHSRRWMYREHTSGSTGTPLTIWMSRQATRCWSGLFEARVLGWNGLCSRDRWAMLGGRLITPVDQLQPPFWAWNAAFRQLYMSSYHLSRDTASAYLEEMRKRRVVYALGYASSLYTLAWFAIELELRAPRLRCVISNAEPLLDHQREVIGRAFGCRVVDTYGMSELVAAGSECASGRMHMWPEVGSVEVMDDSADVPVEPGRVGRLRPLIELDDRQPPFPQRPFESPDDGLPFDVGHSKLASHRRSAAAAPPGSASAWPWRPF
jgi:phenylacetate-CoA ligase